MEYNVIYNKYKNFKNTQYVFFKNREKKLKHIVCVFKNK